MLKQNLKLQILNWKDHCLKENIKKVIGLMKEELAALRAKTYSYLIDEGSQDKKAKCTKMCDIKTKLKFENHKNCLEATQLVNKINHLEKNRIDIDSTKKNHKEFIKNNKLILQTQHIFKSKRHNVFTEEINKIVFSSNDDKRMQSIV